MTALHSQSEVETLRSISPTEIETYMRCREEHRIANVLKIRPRKQDTTLRFGGAYHVGIETWWATLSLEASFIDFNREALQRDLDLYEVAAGEALLTGYHARWLEEHESGLRTFHTERGFGVVRPGPPAFKLTGRIDAIGVKGTRKFVTEHKHTSQDLESGSFYWTKLAINTQISLYAIAARDMKIDPDFLMYDVTRRPDLEPYKATPLDKRKYRKKDGGLYDNQRDRDETVAEYKQRIIDKIAEHPESYYARRDIVRLEHEHARALHDLDTIARDIMRTKPDEPQPRNDGACMRFGRTCDYFAYCCGAESLDSNRFVQIGRRPK